jgi:hypothetical protein
MSKNRGVGAGSHLSGGEDDGGGDGDGDEDEDGDGKLTPLDGTWRAPRRALI